MMDGNKEWKFSYPKRLGDMGLGRNLRYVLDEYGRSFAEQINDFKVLSRGPGKLLFPDYYRYGLYRHFVNGTPEKALEFVSKRQQLPLLKAEGLDWKKDKNLMNKTNVYSELERNDVDHARTVFHYNGDNGNKLRRRLRDRDSYPFFGKPVSGRQSGGVCLAMNHSNGYIEMNDGSMIDIDSFIAGIDKHCDGWLRKRGGYLFQEVLINSKELATAVGETVSTFRMVCHSNRGGHVLKHCVWKLPVDGCIADNHWRGSALAGVDVNTGLVVNAIHGSGVSRENIECHPDTGVKLVGFKVPFWDDLNEFVRNCTSIFPDVRVQSWDIAITNKGIKVVELNPGGDIGLVQLAYDRGVLSKEYLCELQTIAREKNNVDKFNSVFRYERESAK